MLRKTKEENEAVQAEVRRLAKEKDVMAVDKKNAEDEARTIGSLMGICRSEGKLGGRLPKVGG